MVGNSLNDIEAKSTTVVAHLMLYAVFFFYWIIYKGN